MSVFSSLTAIADAIRAKTGKTGGMTLDQMPAEIAGIQGGGGAANELGYQCDAYALYAERVTIGPNTVRNSAELKTFFEGLSKGETVFSFALCGEWTANNQAVYYPNMSSPNNQLYHFVRYRSGALNIASYNSAGYDCVLVEGTEYIIISYTCVPF